MTCSMPITRNIAVMTVMTGLMLGLVAGCSGRGKPNVVRQYKLPPPPPAVPEPRAVRLDSALMAASRQEIIRAYASKDPIVRAHAVEAMQTTVPA